VTASADLANPIVEGAALPDKPLATHQELMVADAERLLPVAAIPISIYSLAMLCERFVHCLQEWKP
jgi:hypothetical protein